VGLCALWGRLCGAPIWTAGFKLFNSGLNGQGRPLGASATAKGSSARHIGVSEPTLRLYYRELIDNAVESACAHVFANLLKTATTKNDAAGVLAAKFILACRAGWKETSRIEVAQNDRGIGGILRMIADAPPEESLQESEDCHLPKIH